jgi:hypothetical protein
MSREERLFLDVKAAQVANQAALTFPQSSEVFVVLGS